MIKTTTEFIILPPCGDKITYEILMNSPHPTLFCNDSLTSFYFDWIIHLRSRLLYSNGFPCQAENYSKQPSWHWLILTFISFRIFPISLFEIPKSSAILKDTAQGSFPAFDFCRMVSSSLLRSTIFLPLFDRMPNVKVPTKWWTEGESSSYEI